MLFALCRGALRWTILPHQGDCKGRSLRVIMCLQGVRRAGIRIRSPSPPTSPT